MHQHGLLFIVHPQCLAHSRPLEILMKPWMISSFLGEEDPFLPGPKYSFSHSTCPHQDLFGFSSNKFFPSVRECRMFSWFSCHFWGNFAYGSLIHHFVFQEWVPAPSFRKFPRIQWDLDFEFMKGAHLIFNSLGLTPHLWYLTNQIQLGWAQNCPCSDPGLWGR